MAAGTLSHGVGIERAGPVVLEPEPASIGSRRRRAVADDDRPHQLLAIPTDVEERAALRRAHPLVAVADRVGGADRVEVEVDHARRVCAVDERVDPAVVERGHDLGHRQHERRRARDVVHHHEPGSRADGREDGVARDLGRRARNGEARGHQPGAGRIGRRLERVAGSRVGVVEQDDLVAGLEAQAARDDVDARGRVRDEGEVVRIGAEEPPERRARVVERRLEVTGEEGDGLALHPRTPRVLRLEHGARRRAERPVVQEGHRGVERPVDGELGGHRLGIVRPMPTRTAPTRSSSTSTARWSTRSARASTRGRRRSPSAASPSRGPGSSR